MSEVNAIWAFAKSTAPGIPYNVAISEPLISVSDIVGKRLVARRAPITETVSIGDTVTKGKVTQRAPATEIVAIGDVVAKTLGARRAPILQSVNIGESIMRIPGSNPGISEQPISIQDVVSARTGIGRTLATETVAISDSTTPLTRLLAAQRAPPLETVSVITDHEFNLDEFNADEFGVEGAFLTAQLAINRTLTTEQIVVGDAVFAFFDAEAFETDIATETVDVSDQSLNRMLAARRTLGLQGFNPLEFNPLEFYSVGETVAVSDSLTVQTARFATLPTETVAVSDTGSPTRLLVATRSLITEVTPIGEVLEHDAAKDVNLTDSLITVVDTVSRVAGLNGIPAVETVVVSDNVSRVITTQRALAVESVTVSGGTVSAPVMVIASRSLPTETVLITDQLVARSDMQRIISTQSVPVSDSAITTLLAAVANISETVPVSDLVQRSVTTAGSVQIVPENTAIADAVTGIMAAPRSIATEVIIITDSVQGAKSSVPISSSKTVRGITTGRRTSGIGIGITRVKRALMTDREEDVQITPREGQ